MAGHRLTGKDKEIFDKLVQVHPGIEYVNFFDGGSTARVYHVRIPIGPDPTSKVDRITKVFRNKAELTQDVDPHAVFKNEIAKLIRVSHTNVVSVFSAGFLKMSATENLPYYIMEFLPGARDFDVWLGENKGQLTRERLIQLLLQAARGLEALHASNIIHCDLKFGNMFVGNTGQLKIADLGFAKCVSSKPGKTGLITTHKYFPRCYRDHEDNFKDKRQMYVELPRDYINVAFDLHYFGQVVHDILVMPLVGHLLSQADFKSLKLIVDRLNLDCGGAALPTYKSITQVISDLEKMQALYLNRAGVEELSTYTGTRTVRIPVSGSIPFTKRVAELIHHPMFFRLNNAHQLGFTHYVFPGATHTRLEHSLGVYSNVSRYINSLIADDHQPYFRQLVDEEMIVTALLAGLLHDIGQHSYAHSLEDVGLAQDHESVAEMLITGKGIDNFIRTDKQKKPLLKVIREYWPEVKINRLCWLITGKRQPRQTTGLGWEIVRAILSGPIDADKTDYLLRDAHHAGVEYARSIDITRFMNSLSASIVKNGQCANGVLAITWKGRQSAENIVLARSQMFWVLYWHHAVRSAHAMMAHACTLHLATLSDSEKLHFNEVLYWGTMGEFIGYLQSSRSKRVKHLSNWLRIRCLFKRAISLHYEDDRGLYDALLKKKTICERKEDRLLLGLSRSIAEQINGTLGRKGLILRLKQEDIIVDIPRADKDKLGQIYVVEKDADMATEYKSQGLMGNYDDWQNRVRKVRIFVHPRIDAILRHKIAEHGREILQKII